MSCERYRPAIAAHAAGDTIAGAAAQHLGSCAACRRRLETGRQLLAEVDAELRHALAPGASPEFAPRVIASVDTGSASRSRRWLPAAWAGFAAAAAIAAVVLFRHGAADPGVVPVPDFRLNAEATRDFQRHAPATRRGTNGADIRLSAEAVPDNTPRPAAASGFRRKPSAPHE